MNARIFALIIGAVALTLAGCVTRVPLDPLPKGEEVFRLPPEQILKDYPLIDGLTLYPQEKPPPIYERFLTIEEISKEWGAPSKSESNWGFAGRRYFLAGLGIPLGSPAVAAVIVGTITVMAPTPPRNATWEKGDYEITGVFDETIFDHSPRLLAWNWKQKEANSSGRDILPGFRGAHPFFALTYAKGGSVIGHSQDGSSTLHAGDSTRVLFGWNAPIENRPLNMKIGAGFDYNGLLLPSRGTHRTFFPIEAVLEYGERQSAIRVGAGATLALAGKFHAYSFDGQTADFSLDPSVGPFIQVGFAPLRGGPVFGIRYSYLPLSGPNIRTIDAGGLGFMLGGFDF